MKSLLSALQFLTIIPVRLNSINNKHISASLLYFPLIGLFLGLVLTGINNLLCIFGFPKLSVDIILVVLLVVLTGGIHLDGLADCGDAFLSRKGREDMLKIMRDSHIGVMGALSIISIILLKISFLYSINMSVKPIALILMCVLSRWSLVMAIFLFPYARLEGKAKVFTQGVNGKIFTVATIITLVCAGAVWGARGLLILLIIAGCTYLIGKFITRKIAGITGDTLGALDEIVEVITLLSICFIGRSDSWIM